MKCSCHRLEKQLLLKRKTGAATVIVAAILVHLFKFRGFKNIHGLSFLEEKLPPSPCEDEPYVSVEPMVAPYLVLLFPCTSS